MSALYPHTSRYNNNPAVKAPSFPLQGVSGPALGQLDLAGPLRFGHLPSKAPSGDTFHRSTSHGSPSQDLTQDLSPDLSFVPYHWTPRILPMSQTLTLGIQNGLAVLRNFLTNWIKGLFGKSLRRPQNWQALPPLDPKILRETVLAPKGAPITLSPTEWKSLQGALSWGIHKLNIPAHHLPKIYLLEYSTSSPATGKASQKPNNQPKDPALSQRILGERLEALMNDPNTPEETRNLAQSLKTIEPSLGGYSEDNHQVLINLTNIRKNKQSVGEIVVHELAHAKDALDRSKVSPEAANRLMVQTVMEGIRGGHKSLLLSDYRIVETANPNQPDGFDQGEVPKFLALGPMSHEDRERIANTFETLYRHPDQALILPPRAPQHTFTHPHLSPWGVEKLHDAFPTLDDTTFTHMCDVMEALFFQAYFLQGFAYSPSPSSRKPKTSKPLDPVLPIIRPLQLVEASRPKGFQVEDSPENLKAAKAAIERAYLGAEGAIMISHFQDSPPRWLFQYFASPHEVHPRQAAHAFSVHQGFAKNRFFRDEGAIERAQGLVHADEQIQKVFQLLQNTETGAVPNTPEAKIQQQTLLNTLAPYQKLHEFYQPSYLASLFPKERPTH